MRDKDQRWQVFVKILKWRIFGKKSQIPKNILNKVYNRTLSFNEFIEYQLYKEIPISCIIESERQIVKNIPNATLYEIYNCTLSFNEFIDYQLEDKIPISCLIESDRKIVEKFGIDKCKELDWELINKKIYDNNIDFRDILMSIDTQTEDINRALYELVKDQIRPSDYSSKMAEIYSDRIFPISQKETDDSKINDLKYKFNKGQIDLKKIISNWDLFKNKDLSYCLLNDKNNKNNMTDAMLKEFMTKYGKLIPLIIQYNDIYSFINTIYTVSTEKEKQEFIKQITDEILSNTYRHGDSSQPIELTDEQYQEIFKYSSLEDYLKIFSDEHRIKPIIDELKTLPQNYVFNMPIPFSVLLNRSVLNFIGIYGLKNIVDFDNECGHFFTKNNCEMLKLMYDMYTAYFPDETFFTKNIIDEDLDENGYRSDRPYTKDEFYEAMRRMIIHGPTNSPSTVPDYREIVGEFRAKNPELFISEQAPEELQKLFYTKSITPQLLLEHPEYIQYLNGKDLSSCLKQITIEVKGNNKLGKYENLYKFLSSKTDFNGFMDFIKEYSDVLEIVFDSKISDDNQYKITFSSNDDINQIQNRLHEALRKIIIEKGTTYPTHIPKKLIENNSSMFLDRNAPQELQEAFYSRTITTDTTEFLLSNPAYREFLNGVDLEILFKYMPVIVMPKNMSNNLSASGTFENGKIYPKTNFINALKQTFGEKDALDVMLIYGKYVEQIYEANKLKKFLYNPEFTQNEFLDEIDKTILQNIIDGNIKYDENISSHFKNNNPTLFLGADVPQEIKDKFYNREFTLKDFNDNPKLLDIFENTNIACAFSENMAWIIPLFNDFENFKTANYNRMKVISAYSKIQDIELQEIFKEFVMEMGNNLDVEKIKFASEVLLRLSLSNSSEIFAFRKELAKQLLKSEDPLESLSKIENIFIKNNIPTVGKIYSCFEILHPDFQGFNFESSMISPVLKKASTTSKKIIVFSDLIKSAFGSNNRSVNAYLRNIEFGSNLYESIKSGQIQFDSLGESEMKELTTFRNHLVTLYNNTMKVKKENVEFISSGNVLTDILELSKKLSPDGTLDYQLADRVIRMFCGFAGIDTLEQAKEYIKSKVETADSRNRNSANSVMVLEQGDFIKGIGGIKYLRNILQNGSVSKEYLGSNAGSDNTPLDTDISMILSSSGTISKKIDETAAKGYGPIWFVLKNDDRFITTRTDVKTLETKNDMSKMEVFYTGYLRNDHYGIRTGFASSEINYIIVDSYDPRIGLEIAINGFYIPVVNKEGKIIFTPKDYDELRSKMSGLSYYGEENYTFSENLITDETEYLAQQIEQNNLEVQAKREKITSIIKKSLEELGLHLKTYIDGDLTEGFVELIDTGSTGRGTNKPNDGDFDFMMRLDKTILSNSSRLNELKQTILRNLGRENTAELTWNGDFRLKSVQIDADISVDIDITFTEKTDKVSYSTDMALQDRLATIQRINPEKYKYVVANILLAKQVLKKAGAYKPNRGEIPQGGLGGVGIENWILQNGGSFIDAAKSFVEASDGKSFSEFKSTYQIWDFGENHLAEKRGLYSHDNFVTENMSEEGYQIMVQALKEYLKTMEIDQIKSGEIKR